MIIIVIILIILAIVLYVDSKKEDIKNMESIGFNITNIIENTIELDENKKLFRIRKSFYNSTTKIYKYSDILEFELLEDDNTIETSAGIGKAIAGGVLFGGVGAIVGANTAKRNSKTVIDSMKIRITLKDIQNPMEFIDVSNSRLKANTEEYRKAIERAQKILSVLSIIKNNSQNEADYIEEIKKYKKLLDDNIISEEEFEKKKKELLKL